MSTGSLDGGRNWCDHISQGDDIIKQREIQNIKNWIAR